MIHDFQPILMHEDANPADVAGPLPSEPRPPSRRREIKRDQAEAQP